MAERISGLQIDLTMNDTSVKRSLTAIKDSFRDVKRAAQVNMNNIRFDTKDVSTYKKNIDELSKSYNNQKKNVDDLKRDRKSTRLNSSHVATSYAVFCLKKKSAFNRKDKDDYDFAL